MSGRDEQARADALVAQFSEAAENAKGEMIEAVDQARQILGQELGDRYEINGSWLWKRPDGGDAITLVYELTVVGPEINAL